MELNDLIAQVTKEVTKKLNENKPVNTTYNNIVSPTGKRGLVIITGCDAYLNEALSQIKALSNIYNLKIIMSSAAEKIIGSSFISSNTGVTDVSSGNWTLMKELTSFDFISVPLLSLNTLSKVSNLILDNIVSAIIVNALTLNIPVFAAKNALLINNADFNQLPFGIARELNDSINKLKSYNMKITDISNLSAEISKTVKSFETKVSNSSSYTNFSYKPEINNVAKNSLNQSNSNICSLISNGDCAGCGLCVINCPDTVRNLMSEGASRIAAKPGVSNVANNIGGLIDHTLLKANATNEEIKKLCEEAREYKFASVCVNPANVELAAKLLSDCSVMVCTVIGFPLGATTTQTKVFETKEAIRKGADEIDMVINVGALKSGNYDLVEEDIRQIKLACGNITLKVILETAMLTDEEKIKACVLSKKANADFVKTSTGFGPGGATAGDIALMRMTVGPEMGVKASGGVRTKADAERMVKAGASRIGASASIAIATGSKDSGKGY